MNRSLSCDTDTDLLEAEGAAGSRADMRRGRHVGAVG